MVGLRIGEMCPNIGYYGNGLRDYFDKLPPSLVAPIFTKRLHTLFDAGADCEADVGEGDVDRFAGR